MSIHSIAVGVILCVLASSSARGQGEVRFGATLGVTSSELREELGGLGSRLGLDAGLFVSLPVWGGVDALVAADYYRKGYKLEGEFRGPTNLPVGTDPDYQYDYISLLTAPSYGDDLGGSGFRFYAFAGPRLDVLVADRVVATVEGERETVELSFDTPEFNAVVFGASAGIGLDLARVLAAPLLLELRYDADVTPAWETPREFRFRTFSLRAGLSF